MENNFEKTLKFLVAHQPKGSDFDERLTTAFKQDGANYDFMLELYPNVLGCPYDGSCPAEPKSGVDSGKQHRKHVVICTLMIQTKAVRKLISLLDDPQPVIRRNAARVLKWLRNLGSATPSEGPANTATEKAQVDDLKAECGESQPRQTQTNIGEARKTPTSQAADTERMKLLASPFMTREDLDEEEAKHQAAIVKKHQAAIVNKRQAAIVKEQAANYFPQATLSDGVKPLGFLVYISNKDAMMRLWGIAALGVFNGKKGKIGYLLRQLDDDTEQLSPEQALSMKSWDGRGFVVRDDHTWHDGQPALFPMYIDNDPLKTDWDKVWKYRHLATKPVRAPAKYVVKTQTIETASEVPTDLYDDEDEDLDDHEDEDLDDDEDEDLDDDEDEDLDDDEDEDLDDEEDEEECEAEQEAEWDALGKDELDEVEDEDEDDNRR